MADLNGTLAPTSFPSANGSTHFLPGSLVVLSTGILTYSCTMSAIGGMNANQVAVFSAIMGADGTMAATQPPTQFSCSMGASGTMAATQPPTQFSCSMGAIGSMLAEQPPSGQSNHYLLRAYDSGAPMPPYPVYWESTHFDLSGAPPPPFGGPLVGLAALAVWQA